jgi:hypothetical protein
MKSNMARFLSKFVIGSSEECWEWLGARSRGGYGYFCGMDGKNIKAHRFSWAIANGEIPAGMCVCHTCDNTGCVNPNHLFLGTVLDNMLDKINKGHGSENRLLSVTEVEEIRASNDNYKELSNRYKVSSATIDRVRMHKGAYR